MAFNRLKGLDNSDMRVWATSDPAQVFISEVMEQRNIALRNLLKCKASDHDQWKESYKAFDKVITFFDEAANLK
jgi:hypothetical protein